MKKFLLIPVCAIFCALCIIDSANAVTVTFSCGSGSGTPPASRTASYGSTFLYPENTCTPPAGYSFDSWQITCPMKLTFPAGTSGTWMCSSNSTVTAQYKAATYTITYSCGSGSGTAPTTNTSATYNSNFTPAANSCTAPGNKSFSGWLVSGTSDTKAAGVAFKWTYTENKTLTAQYVDPVYLNWYDNGTAMSGGPSACVVGGTFVPPTPPARPGYIFAGWKANPITKCGIDGMDFENGDPLGWPEEVWDYRNASGQNTTYSGYDVDYGLGGTTNTFALPFPRGVLYGSALCSTSGSSTGTIAQPSTNHGQHCWCKLTGFTASGNSYASGPLCTVSPESPYYVYFQLYNYTSDCDYDCAHTCADYVINDTDWGLEFSTWLLTPMVEAVGRRQ